MKSVNISNITFPFDKGLIVLKHKVKQEKKEEEYKDLYDAWKEVEPLTVQTALSFENIEQRRVAIGLLGIEKIVSELKGELVGRETIRKTTMYVNPQGQLVNNEYDDTYELYRIDGNLLWGNAETDGPMVFRQQDNDVYFVKMYCTSTNREYLIWIHKDGVAQANSRIVEGKSIIPKTINPIQAIAWTIQTNIPKGSIEKIIRQGDCIFLKPSTEYCREEHFLPTRHLSESEYRELLVAES